MNPDAVICGLKMCQEYKDVEYLDDCGDFIKGDVVVLLDSSRKHHSFTKK
jgi:hypothetical protein